MGLQTACSSHKAYGVDTRAVSMMDIGRLAVRNFIMAIVAAHMWDPCPWGLM